MSRRSIHPYAPYVPAGAETLIIGTIPPYRFCGGGERQLFAGDVDFYYGSRSNRFWQLVSEAAGVQLQYADTPAAVIGRGTRHDQQVRTGTLQQLDALAHDAPMPALLVIGEVVALHRHLAWFGQQTWEARQTGRSAVVNLA